MTREESKSSVPFARQRHPQIIGAPPPLEMAAPVRKSRSMSELPGHLRVPILKRKDTERTQARLEAGAAGVAELQALREQHQQLVTATMEESKQKSQHKKQRKKEREDRHSRYQSVQSRPQISGWHSANSLASIHEDNPAQDDVRSGQGYTPQLSVFQTADHSVNTQQHSPRQGLVGGGAIDFGSQGQMRHSVDFRSPQHDFRSPLQDFRSSQHDFRSSQHDFRPQRRQSFQEPPTHARHTRYMYNDRHTDRGVNGGSHGHSSTTPRPSSSTPAQQFHRSNDPSTHPLEDSSDTRRRCHSVSIDPRYFHQRRPSEPSCLRQGVLQMSSPVSRDFSAAPAHSRSYSSCGGGGGGGGGGGSGQNRSPVETASVGQHSHSGRSSRRNSLSDRSSGTFVVYKDGYPEQDRISRNSSEPRNGDSGLKAEHYRGSYPQSRPSSDLKSAHRSSPPPNHPHPHPHPYPQLSHTASDNCLATTNTTAPPQGWQNGTDTRRPPMARRASDFTGVRPASVTSAPPSALATYTSGRMRPADKCLSWDNLLKAIGVQSSTTDLTAPPCTSGTSPTLSDDDDDAFLPNSGSVHRQDKTMPSSESVYKRSNTLPNSRSTSMTQQHNPAVTDRRSFGGDCHTKNGHPQPSRTQKERNNCTDVCDRRSSVDGRALDANPTKSGPAYRQETTFGVDDELSVNRTSVDSDNFRDKQAGNGFEDSDMCALGRRASVQHVPDRTRSDLSGSTAILRRASIQCEAVLTKHKRNYRIVSPIKGVDIKSLHSPGPLHAVTLQFHTGLGQRDRGEVSPSKLTTEESRTSPHTPVSGDLEGHVRGKMSRTYEQNKRARVGDNAPNIPLAYTHSRNGDAANERVRKEENSFVSKNALALPSQSQNGACVASQEDRSSRHNTLGVKAAKSPPEHKHGAEKGARRFLFPDRHGTILEESEDAAKPAATSPAQPSTGHQQDSHRQAQSHAASIVEAPLVTESVNVLESVTCKEQPNVHSKPNTRGTVKQPTDGKGRNLEVRSKSQTEEEMSSSDRGREGKGTSSAEETFTSGPPRQAKVSNLGLEKPGQASEKSETLVTSIVATPEISHTSEDRGDVGLSSEGKSNSGGSGLTVLAIRDRHNIGDLHLGKLPERDPSISSSSLTVMSSVDLSVASDEGYHTCDSASPNRKLFFPLQLTPTPLPDGSSRDRKHSTLDVDCNVGSSQDKFSFRDENGNFSTSERGKTISDDVLNQNVIAKCHSEQGDLASTISPGVAAGRDKKAEDNSKTSGDKDLQTTLHTNPENRDRSMQTAASSSVTLEPGGVVKLIPQQRESDAVNEAGKQEPKTLTSSHSEGLPQNTPKPFRQTAV